jgi:type I restriction-modification system DNA methylase subunit
MEQLQEVADLYGPQVLERRCDAWARLLATFRAVHGGVNHQDLLMPAYGGSLFDPDRYPFLEGRATGTKWANTPANLLDVNNRVVLHLLSSLQRLRMKVPGGGPSESRRISFRALGVEQIGHVYEGLLDHTAVRATEPVLGMKGTRDKETEIPLAKLETTFAKGRDELVEFLHDETGRSQKAISRALDEGTLNEEHRLLIACGHDAGLLHRVHPFAGLIREDSFERPVVVLPGSIYVTAGTARRSTGTHYTPPSLTEPIVQYTLEPLVYSGPAEGLPQEQWQLKSPKEILNLKVCDMAMGSGAFLVQACRYLSERLTESWENEEKKHPDEILVTPEGDFSQGSPSERLIPQDAAERLAIARRIVADRCLYGVDINPMAVEMAKLSMWLVTLDAKRPFTFLDHAFKCGDSLLGLTSFKQLEHFSMRPEGVKQVAFSTMNLWRHVEEAKKKRQMLEAMPSDTPEQVSAKSALYAEAEEAVIKLKAAADVLVAEELKGLTGKKYEEGLELAADRMMFYWSKGVEELRDFANSEIERRRTLHWPLDFPEIMDRGGFDALVGNPPFVGGQKITSSLGTSYRSFLVLVLAKDKRGSADLCAYFFLQALKLINSVGTAGLLATNTIAQGDTREVGLDQIVAEGMTIYRANPSRPWPGAANLEVAHVWMLRGDWKGSFVLDDIEVPGIISSLTAPGIVKGKPHRLSANLRKCIKGSEVGGMDAFVITREVAEVLADKDLNAPKVVLRPFIGYEDLVANEFQQTNRFCIYFSDWDIESAEEYPACLEYIRSHTGESTRIDWWRFRRPTPELYRAIARNQRVLVIGETSEAVAPIFVTNGQIFTKTLIVFSADSASMFSIVTSSLHYAWVLQYGSTLETRAKYIITDCFETFPFPHSISSLELIGEHYHSKRHMIMRQRHIGLTELYNLFHDADCQESDIRELREIHRELDSEVARAYGWANCKLDHGFNRTKQGLRYTISEAARREVLDLLLALNHQRHAEEKAEEMILGKQPQARGKRGRKAKAQDAHSKVTLFSEVGDQE